MDQLSIFDPSLIAKYDQSGPRYTSYPTAVEFHEGYTAQDYRSAALASNDSGKPLSLYFHLPFCDTVCFYCACNKVATKDRSKATDYLQRLYNEIEMQGRLFDKSRPVNQLHWGGGTPTFISRAEMRELMRVTSAYFTLLNDDSGEYSIEIDPREATGETIVMLRDLGFNRMSLGVQDFDPRVQQAVNRIQSESETMTVLEAARNEGFRSISIDLIYGLPFQSVASFRRTLDRIIEVQADRLSIFNYAHLPERFKPQRRIDAGNLPPPEEKLEILGMAIERLTEAGYVYIGMDHFARPEDELTLAQQKGTLYRNFQGYSTHADCDLVAMGVSSIGMVGSTYSQNVRSIDDYYQRLSEGRLPVFRGFNLDRDDQIRRDVITRLICHFALDFAWLRSAWGVRFSDYFSEEYGRLRDMERDGLLTLDDSGIQVCPPGRLLIRNLCMVFDAYLDSKQSKNSFSKLI